MSTETSGAPPAQRPDRAAIFIFGPRAFWDSDIELCRTAIADKGWVPGGIYGFDRLLTPAAEGANPVIPDAWGKWGDLFNELVREAQQLVMSKESWLALAAYGRFALLPMIQELHIALSVLESAGV